MNFSLSLYVPPLYQTPLSTLVVDEEKDDPKYAKEQWILAGDGGFWTVTSFPQLECLDIPVAEEFFNEAAAKGILSCSSTSALR